MPAYVIAEIEVKDPVTYEEYRQVAGPTLAPYVGRFVVRGAAAERLEGDRDPQRIVVLEFPSVERAKAWWASEEYAGPKAIRQRSASSRLIVVAGVDDAS